MTQPQSHLDYALGYASLGWRVVPTHTAVGGVCSCLRGAECTAAGKHPRPTKWQEVATKDEGQIRRWWGLWPDANISIALGRESGIFVVDIDGEEGWASADDYQRFSEHGFPATLAVTTGSGRGKHLFYAWPEGATIGNKVGWLSHVDIRGEGGQVIAPPSLHRSGNTYTWDIGGGRVAATPPDELVQSILRSQGDGKSDRGRLLDDFVLMMKGVAEGSRDDTMFRWACRLRNMYSDDRTVVTAMVLQAAGKCSPPFTEAEALKCVDQAFKQARDYDNLTQWKIAQVVNEKDGNFFPLTDNGNALRYATLFAGEVRYAGALGWMAWDGARYQRDDRLVHERLAREVFKSIAREADGVEENDAKAILKWAAVSQSAARVNSMIELARSDVRVISVPGDYDNHDLLLNMANGTMDLSAWKFRLHDRDDMMTRMAPVTYDPKARWPLWDSFLRRVVPDDDLRRYLQKALGYSLTGLTDAKSFFMLYGPGNNGKTIFLEVIKLVLGDYAGAASKNVFIQSRSEQHPTSVASLDGLRYVTCAEEIAPGDRLNETLLKSLTGGDQMKARYMRRDEFTFTPRAKLWLGTNHKPTLRDFSQAMKSRIKLVPFTEVIAVEERRDRSEIMLELSGESSGILNWMLEGWWRYRTDGGLGAGTIDMEAALEEYVAEEDVTGEFVEEWLEEDASSFLTTGEIHARYVSWMELRGEGRFAVTAKRLGRELADKGIPRGRTPEGRGFRVRWSKQIGAYGV